MAAIEPIPLEVEIHPEIKNRLDALERHQTEQDALIDHWRGVALTAGEIATDVKKTMKANPARGGVLIRNVVLVGGLTSVTVGCWWILPAASLVVTGSILLGLVVFGTVARHKLELERVRSAS